MKTSFAVLGIIFLIVISIGGIGFGLLAMRGNPVEIVGFWFLGSRSDALDKESKAYADAAIPAIFATGGERELLERESPEFKQSVTQQQLDQTFQRISALGHLQKCEPAQGQSIISLTTQAGQAAKQVKAQYGAKATFDKGDAAIDLSLIKHGDQWQVLGFFVNPSAPPPPQQQPQQQPH